MSIYKQIEIAMLKQPSLNIIEIIDEAMDYTYPSSKKVIRHEFKRDCAWKYTNADILKALIKYNEKK